MNLIIEKLPQGWTKQTRGELLQALAQQYCSGARIEHLPTGRPHLVGGADFEVSISHTADFIAFMIDETGKRCGVDIELISRRSEHISRRFAVESELEIVKLVFPENPTLLIWCAKEALYKLFDREGCDFKADLQIIEANSAYLKALAYGELIEMRWQVDEKYNLLIVNTL